MPNLCALCGHPEHPHHGEWIYSHQHTPKTGDQKAAEWFLTAVERSYDEGGWLR